MTNEFHTARAHAKINLVLRILAREASGYHGIETLFQLLELHDLVHVRVGTMPPSLTCAGPTMPIGGLGPAEQNLAWRAAVAYTDASGWHTGWEIEIEKNIPVGGGLGGGSADAAAVLRAFEALSPAPLGMERLLQIAGTLGADVPFLVSGESLAWAWGRGDRLLPLPALPRAAVLLAVFPDGVNTGAAYGAFARAREARGETVQALSYPAGAFSSWASIATLAVNDFEPVVSEMHAGVASVLPALRAVANGMHRTESPAFGMMSGSGATCYLLHHGAPGLQTNEPVTFVDTYTR
jgi:4-diphosphocytidyl-2-C-methyl-D-erythritol kinase